jgi:hypothetical protein
MRVFKVIAQAMVQVENEVNLIKRHQVFYWIIMKEPKPLS